MSDDQPERWEKRPWGVVLINGVIPAIVGYFLGQGVNVLTKVPWWVPVIIAAAFALLASLVFARFRHVLWGGARRCLKWLFELRVLTRTQRQQLIDDGYGKREAKQAVLDAAEKVRLDANKEMVDELLKKVANRAPLPLPRWRLDRIQNEGQLVMLKNTVDRSVAREVRLECVHWRFLDGASWPDLSGVSEGTFSGDPLSIDRNTSAISFEVSWYDELNKKKTEQVWLELNPIGWLPF